MCVIYACATQIPPEEELRRGAQRNSDGAGVAWIKAGKTPAVQWEKGLKGEKEVLELIAAKKIGFPLAIHFRTASVGGPTPYLSHPFPLTSDVGLDLAGTAPSVLFHNGHVGNWEELVFRTMLSAPDFTFPRGVWSDTRALAMMVYLKGEGILRFVAGGSRVLTFAPPVDDNPWSAFDFYGSWEDVEEEEKQGWLQSIATKSSTITNIDLWKNRHHYVTDPDEEPDACTMPEAKTLGPDDSQKVALNWQSEAVNVWTVEELNAILASLEKELADARSAAGL